MRSFIVELRRRNVFRAGALYVAGVWALAQGVAQLGPAFGMPDWGTRWFVIAAVIGFPFWTAFAWFYEFTPEGLKRESAIDPAESITAHTGKTLDRWIIAVLAVAVVLLLTNQLVSRRDSDKRAETAAEGAVAVANASRAAIPDIEKDPSIAVLPLDNMSSDKEQDYFSDGISEELLNLLAKVPKLRVIARTSSFAFKGKEIGIPEIARALNVAALLEGSVRKSGNTVRITMQLIRASDSSHLWSETYDRTLDDIFKVQDEIAATVVDKLKITLLGAAPTVKPIDPKAYPLILQADALTSMSAPASGRQAIALYQAALAIAPDEPRAWSGLGRAYLLQASLAALPPAEGSRLAKEALNKAVALNPGDAAAYSRLGFAYSILDGDPAAGARLFQKALALEPGNLVAIGNASTFLGSLGRAIEAVALDQYRIPRDPANPQAYGNLANSYYFSGHWDQSIAANRTALDLSPELVQARYVIGSAILLGKGDASAALKEMQAEPDEIGRMSGVTMALHALGRNSESDAALADLIARHEKDGAFYVAEAFAFRGEADRAFDWLDKAIANQDPNISSIHTEPQLGNLRQDPRWLPLLRKLGQAPEQLAKIEFKVTLPQDAVAQSVDAQKTH